jgi:hypothetical protein
MVLDKIYEFENVLAPNYADYLEEFSKNINDWKFYEDINLGENSINKSNRPGWVTGQFDNKTKYIIENLIKNTLTRLNLFEKKILRIKINKTEAIDISEEECYSGMHVDGLSLGYKNDLILIYYINDSTGDTLITDLHSDNVENIEELNKKIEIGEFTDFNIIKRITPQKGKIIAFDGGYFHCGMWPKKDNRYVININLQFYTDKTKLNIKNSNLI